MRRNSLLAVFLAFVLAACGGESALKVSLDIPGAAAVGKDRAPSFLLTGFFVEKAAPGFDVNAAVVGYLLDELKPRIKGTVEAAPVAWPSPDALADKEFWRTAGAGRAALILTGKAEFTQETRKALLEGERRDFDGPFKSRSPWSERKFFSLRLDVAVLDARTGESVFRRDYKESINSENAKQTAEYAVYDMMGRIKTKLLRSLFGSERPQDRYLLSR